MTFNLSFLKVSRLFLYISVFAVVVVMISTFFPFIGGKDYFFRTAVELALIFFVLWWAFEACPGEARVRLARYAGKPIFIFVSLFVLVFLLAAIFASDPRAAFWSNYERGEGAFQMLHYYGLFVLSLLAFDSKEHWRTLFRVSVVAAVLMISYGIIAATFSFNFVGPYRLPNGDPVASTFLGRLFKPDVRFEGSIGNPAYVAPYLMFTMFYALWLWSSGRQQAWRHVRYGVLLLLFLLFFTLSQTRGGFLGLGVAALVFLLYLAVFHRQTRRWAIALVVLLAIGGGTLFAFRNRPFVSELPGGRFLQISLHEESVQTRLWTWGSAWRGFLERPLLGWGPENFGRVFDKHFDVRHFNPNRNTETWFDRAHSVFFDYLSETGILGVLSYLGIFGALFVDLFRSWRREYSGGPSRVAEYLAPWRRTPIQNGLLVAMPVGYLVQGLALFDVLPIYINLFIFLAFASYVLYGTAREHHAE